MSVHDHTHQVSAFLIAAILAAIALTGAEASSPQARNGTYEVRAPASGAGTRSVSGPDAVEIAVTGDGVFPARASDPVLHIGSRTLRKYRYEGTQSRVLVFTVPKGTSLANGDPIYLQYEPGTDIRIDLGTYRSGAKP